MGSAASSPSEFQIAFGNGKFLLRCSQTALHFPALEGNLAAII